MLRVGSTFLLRTLKKDKYASKMKIKIQNRDKEALFYYFENNCSFCYQCYNFEFCNIIFQWVWFDIDTIFYSSFIRINIDSKKFHSKQSQTRTKKLKNKYERAHQKANVFDKPWRKSLQRNVSDKKEYGKLFKNFTKYSKWM